MKQPLLSEISRRRKLALLLRHISPGERILEVGSGEGCFAEELRERGFAVTTVDIASPKADIQGDINDYAALGIAEDSHDVVVALELIEHVDCLDALRAICRPGGLIMLSSPHPRWDWAMRILENLGLNQKRTSEHCNLTDFTTIPLETVVYRRPLYIHQVGLFRNPRTTASAGR